MINALFIHFVDIAEDVIDWLGGVGHAAFGSAAPKSEIKSKLKLVVLMCVQNKAVDLGDLHTFAVCFAVSHCLQHLAGGGIV